MTHILIVEDEAALREDLCLVFEFEGYTAEGVANGREALAVMAMRTPDLVCSDLLMPVMDGYEMLAVMQEDERWMDVPVVLVSARTSRADVQHGLQAGAAAYIIKPFNTLELIQKIKAIVAP